ncbi:MAG TPA: hypothetical protein VN915_06760 [Elusimicrobiota bacterium]|nr:hypothetical protein [Elusimicrobiota bacterium]
MKSNRPFSWLEQMLVVMVLTVMMMAIAPLAKATTCATGAGTCVFEIGVSTPAATFVLLTTGQGTLNNLVISSRTAAAGDFCVAFDSASTSGLTIEGDGTSVAPRIMATSVVATNTVTPQPANAPAVPFLNGIAVGCSAARRATVILNK